ncbi:hypothetical protein M8998_05750 [Sphingobacterium sp. lm-10]|uniref:hypothetical protein n=1 Tax=Sphingobacterium sp. lm-10 TaxID=2944904 RepID=UPI0020220568|nr:hypothetical protein [Sphingobacterium sp. lm-10]MCL7987440.1 hypothetical protein [Sphingobacterium sp. lm-10]
MKTSNSIFASILVLILLVVCVPQLLGLIKVGPDDKPADFLSRFWFNQSDQKKQETISEEFSHIQLNGDGRPFSLILNKGTSGSTNAFAVAFKDLKMNVENDTLFITSLNERGSYVSLDIAHKLSDVTIKHANVSAVIAPELLDSMRRLNLLGQSELFLTHAASRETDTIQKSIPKLAIFVSEQSKAFLMDYNFKQVDVDLHDGLLRYSPSLKVDTMNVKLAGKSAVSSTQYDDNNQIQVLKVSGNKEYFHKELIGGQVRLNLISE